MPVSPAPAAPPRPLDTTALRRVRARLQAAERPPWLHAEVARRMAERLAIVRLQPRRVLDWWSTCGATQELLHEAYPQAEVSAVEVGDDVSTAPAAAQPAPWWSLRRWRAARGPALREGGVEAGSAQLVWANMGLHLQADPQQAMARWHRALAVDGFLMFSTLGPGTLEELRSLYARLGWPSPHAAFVDMHDLGDMLVETGFADPVMDQEQLTLHWPDARALLAELRGLGGNADRRRFPGLRTPRWRERLLAGLAEQCARADGRPGLTFEIVYGHAVRVAPRAPVQEHTTIALEDMRAMVAARRR